MKAIILAAGQGSRLRPLTYAIPKPLLPVGGRPVIDYVIDNLSACGQIDEVYVAVSHAASVIRAYFHHANHHRLKISVVRTLGWETGGDLKTVLIEKNITSPVVVCYGDNVTQPNVSELLDFHSKNPSSYASMLLFSVPRSDASRFGIAELQGEKITRFIEKPQPGSTISNLANAGYFVLNPDALSNVQMKKFKLESECFPQWAAERKLGGIVQQLKMWIDIGTIDSYRAANKLVEEILPPPSTHQQNE
ncbi:nucleotidyltransferase family protein [Candidatus Micrarchaeota archaeon]|nr:nucleotidyltransferase family protein [Candidatus Micrarchaeota archaeon]